MYSDLQYLDVDLPEDILKLKWFGDFERALRVIDMRLKTELPKALCKRLELEKEILKRLPESYPYKKEEVLSILKAQITDFDEEELERLQDENAVDWIYVYGTIHYRTNILKNLIRTRESYARRVKDKKLLFNQLSNSRLLDDTMREMKEKGSLSRLIRVKISLKVKKEFEQTGKVIRVHLPIPLEYAQVKEFRILESSLKIQRISPPDYPQRTVYFEEVQTEGQLFSVTYEFVNSMKYLELDFDDVEERQPDFYIEEHRPHIRFTPYIKALVNEVAGEEKNSLKKVRSFYNYITMNVMYSFVRPYCTILDIPAYAALGLKGDCGIQSLLFITMCRCAGIPARWQSGLYAAPLDNGCHDWAQFYIKPYGWIYADCSFGGDAYREGNFERWNFYFGNLEPYRVPTASMFQCEHMPPETWMRDDPYDNQLGEAEYENRGLTGKALEREAEILKIEPVSRRE